MLAGYPLVDVKVALFDGSYHDVDSSAMAFELAGSMALSEGARRAKPVLLEPVMQVEVVTPEEYIGVSDRRFECAPRNNQWNGIAKWCTDRRR